MMRTAGRTSETFDVIIVGGGPAGASAATRLALAGARVLLVEQSRFPRAKLCGEFISPECLSHFAQLGVMEELLDAGAMVVRETRFFTSRGRSVAVPSEWFAPLHEGALGLSRAEMDRRLLERARSVGVEVLEETIASGVLIEEGRVCGVHVHAAGERDLGRTFRSRVTVDATGRARVLAERALREVGGASVKRRRATLVAFKAHLEHARGREGVCEIYFYRGGYGGLSPVEDNSSNLCFIARAREVRACGSDPERVMREVLMKNERAARTLRDARTRTRWLSVALESFGRGRPVPVEGLITVGDAASFIDPFTGSGMLMALESGELAAQTIGAWLAGGTGADSFASLASAYRAEYERRFGARLRLCGWLRRAAFAPSPVTEGFVLALGANERLRRTLARATRRTASSAPPRV